MRPDISLNTNLINFRSLAASRKEFHPKCKNCKSDKKDDLKKIWYQKLLSVIYYPKITETEEISEILWKSVDYIIGTKELTFYSDLLKMEVYSRLCWHYYYYKIVWMSRKQEIHNKNSSWNVVIYHVKWRMF